MAQYKSIDRTSELFVAGDLDSLLPPTSMARSIWAALDNLDFSIFDAAYSNDLVGRKALSPRMLVGVWILALVRGDTSSLHLAYLCQQDIEYRWLLGGNQVEKSTLCDFRKKHGEALSELGSQVLCALAENGLLCGEQVGVDGTVVRAASSKHSVKSVKGMRKRAKRLQEVLREKLSSGDTAQEGEVKHLEDCLQKVQETLEQMRLLGLTEDERMNTTEPSASLCRQKDGSFAPGYNIQAAVDLASGAVIQAEALEGGSDSGQFEPQVEQARVALEQAGCDSDNIVQAATADGAYHDARQLVSLEEQGVACFVPEDRNANRVPPDIAPEYRASAFDYDEENDTFQCPQGHTLKRSKLNDNKTSAVYQANAGDCSCCPAKDACCPKSKTGRRVNRPLYKETLDKVAERVQSEQGGWMRRARAVTCEGAFARLNNLLHWKRCRMWGRAGVEAELRWRQLAHNLMLLAGVWEPLVTEPMRA